MVVDSDRDRADLKQWFDELWIDDALVKDVKAKVLEYPAQLYINHSPEFTYFKTVFHIFERFLAGQDETANFFENTTITDSEIWKTLFDFQKDGVKGAIQKINQHNGCILTDSVGLGKTYSALAVIKYLELRNHRVLVLCPKKLQENCMVYLGSNIFIPPSAVLAAACVNSVIAVWLAVQIFATKQGGFFDFEPRYSGQIPIPVAIADQIAIIEQIVFVVSTAINRPEYERLLNGLVYELFFPENLKAKNIHLFDACTAACMKPGMNAKAMAQSIFNPSHSIYAQLFELQTIDVVRVIEGPT